MRIVSSRTLHRSILEFRALLLHIAAAEGLGWVVAAAAVCGVSAYFFACVPAAFSFSFFNSIGLSVSDIAELLHPAGILLGGEDAVVLIDRDADQRLKLARIVAVSTDVCQQLTLRG